MAALRLALTLVRLLAARALRQLVVTAALWVLALMFLMFGIAGLLAALWLWLAQMLGAVPAALMFGGAGLVLAGALMLIARSRRLGLLSSPDVVDLQAALNARMGTLEVWIPLIAVALAAFFLARRPKE